MKQLDGPLAKTCLKQYRALIVGPPNCRTPPSTLLDAALSFISDKEASLLDEAEAGDEAGGGARDDVAVVVAAAAAAGATSEPGEPTPTPL